MNFKCIYCENNEVISDSHGRLLTICTKVESKRFLTNVECFEGCEYFEQNEEAEI